MRASFRLALGAGCIALVALAPGFAQAVYQWKDAKGVTHYSDTPPKDANRAVRTVEVPPPPPVSPSAAKSTPVSAATVARAPAAPAVDPVVAQREAAARAGQCKQAPDNLAILQANAAVAVDEDGDGKSDKVLDQAQRDAQVKSMQVTIQSACGAY